MDYIVIDRRMAPNPDICLGYGAVLNREWEIDIYIYFSVSQLATQFSYFTNRERKKMTGSDSQCRMVIASQTCEPKGWKDENGREQCWEKLGGLVAERVNPIDETKWFDNDKRIFGSLCT